MKTFVTLFRKNAWFFLPFLFWALTGAVMQSIFTREELFMAINQTHNTFADVLMTGFTYLGDGTTFAIVLVGLLIAKKFRLFFMGLSTILLVTLVVQVAKHSIDAPRPLAYFQDPAILHMVKWVAVHSHNSFPSGHSAGAFALFGYLALIDKNKQRGLLFIALALVAAYSRIYLAQHFFADIYIGSLIGCVCSVVVYSLFEFRNITKTPVLCEQAEAALLAEAKLGESSAKPVIG